MAQNKRKEEGGLCKGSEQDALLKKMNATLGAE